MRITTFTLVLLTVIGACSCHMEEEPLIAEETIQFNRYEQVPCGSLDRLLPGRVKRIVLNAGGNKDYMFSEIDKIVCIHDQDGDADRGNICRLQISTLTGTVLSG